MVLFDNTSSRRKKKMKEKGNNRKDSNNNNNNNNKQKGTKKNPWKMKNTRFDFFSALLPFFFFGFVFLFSLSS